MQSSNERMNKTGICFINRDLKTPGKAPEPLDNMFDAVNLCIYIKKNKDFLILPSEIKNIIP